MVFNLSIMLKISFLFNKIIGPSNQTVICYTCKCFLFRKLPIKCLLCNFIYKKKLIIWTVKFCIPALFSKFLNKGSLTCLIFFFFCNQIKSSLYKESNNEILKILFPFNYFPRTRHTDILTTKIIIYHYIFSYFRRNHSGKFEGNLTLLYLHFL